jgi:hypothetical protein
MPPSSSELRRRRSPRDGRLVPASRIAAEAGTRRGIAQRRPGRSGGGGRQLSRAPRP